MSIRRLNQIQYMRAVDINHPHLKCEFHLTVHIEKDYQRIIGTPVIHFFYDEPDNNLGEILCLTRTDAVNKVIMNGKEITREDGELWATIFGIVPNQG